METEDVIYRSTHHPYHWSQQPRLCSRLLKTPHSRSHGNRRTAYQRYVGISSSLVTFCWLIGWFGSVRFGSVRFGRLGSVRFGSVRLGSARLGSARLGSARLGSARLGSARLGSAGWLAGWFVGWMVGWLVGWVALWLDGWLVGWLIGWLVGWLVGWLADWLAGWLLDCGGVFLKLFQFYCHAAAKFWGWNIETFI